MNKLILLGAVSFLFFLIPFVSSQEQQTLGTFKQNTCVILKQTCSNCTQVNITRIAAPNSSVVLSTPVVMTKTDTVYNHSFCTNGALGKYIVDWKANPDGTFTCSTCTGNYDYQITTTGFDLPIAFQFLFIGIVFAVLTVGLYKRDVTITLLSTFGLYFVGLWMLFYGFNIYKNLYTEGFSFITLGIAGYLSIIMAHEYIV